LRGRRLCDWRLSDWRVSDWRLSDWRVSDWRVSDWRVSDWRVSDWRVSNWRRDGRLRRRDDSCTTRLQRRARRDDHRMVRAHRAFAHFECTLAMTNLYVDATARRIDLGQRFERRRHGEIVRELQLLANLERASRELFAAVIVLLMEPHLRETRQDRSDLGMTRAERLLLDREQSREQRTR
jgi:hypothetical protein